MAAESKDPTCSENAQHLPEHTPAVLIPSHVEAVVGKQDKIEAVLLEHAQISRVGPPEVPLREATLTGGNHAFAEVDTDVLGGNSGESGRRSSSTYAEVQYPLLEVILPISIQYDLFRWK